MEYRSFVSLNIAIIGSNRLSEALTLAYTDAGHNVYAATTEGDSSPINPHFELLNNVRICDIETAAACADFVVVCTRANDVREVAYWLGDVRRKVIIDLTANVPEGLKDNMNTVNAIKSITGATHIVKGLSLYNHEDLFSPLFGGNKVQLVMVGDSQKAKEMLKIISVELGVTRFHDFGGADHFTLFDELCKCCRSMMKISYNKVELAIHK